MTVRSHVNELACCLMLGAAVATAAGQASPTERVVISADQVARAIAATGAAVRAGQVRFLAQVSASREDVSLEVVSVKNQDQQATVKLRCHNSQECLPFYVLVERIGWKTRGGRYRIALNGSGRRSCHPGAGELSGAHQPSRDLPGERGTGSEDPGQQSRSQTVL
jgi:hypothetical protein